MTKIRKTKNYRPKTIPNHNMESLTFPFFVLLQLVPIDIGRNFVEILRAIREVFLVSNLTYN